MKLYHGLDNYVKFRKVQRLLLQAKTETCYIFPATQDESELLKDIIDTIDKTNDFIVDVLQKEKPFESYYRRTQDKARQVQDQGTV